MSLAVESDDGESWRVHEVLCRWGPDYLEPLGSSMPSREREVLATILCCRTPALGGSLHLCPDCGHSHFSYHSWNDRLATGRPRAARHGPRSRRRALELIHVHMLIGAVSTL